MAYASSLHSGAPSVGPPLQPAPQRQLRTRPVDGAKPLLIVRSLKDLETLAEEEGIRLDAASLGFLSASEFVAEDLTQPAAKKPRQQSIAVPPIEKEDRVFQRADFVQPDFYLRTEVYKEMVVGLRLSDGSLVHYDMLLEDEQFVDALNAELNQANLLSPHPVYMPADPGAAAAFAASGGSPAAAAAAASSPGAAAAGDAAVAPEAEQQQQQQQQQHPTAGPFRLVLDPVCLHNKSLFLSDLSFVKLMDALEKEAHARGGSELSVSAADAARIAAHDLNLGLHAVVCKHVHAHWQRRRRKLQKPLLRHLWPQPSPADTSPLAVFRPRVGREKMTLRKQKRIGRDALVRAEKLLDDCRLVEKVLRRMRTRDEKKEHLLEVRSLMFEQQRFELTDPLYTHPLWAQLRDRVKGAASRRGDRRGDRKALMPHPPAAAAAAPCAAAAAASAVGSSGGLAGSSVGSTAGALSAGGSGVGAPRTPLGLGAGGPHEAAAGDPRHQKKSSKRERASRFFPACQSSWMLKSKGNRHWRPASQSFLGASPLPPSLIPPSTPLLFAAAAAAAAKPEAAAAAAEGALEDAEGGPSQGGPPKCRYRFIRRRGRGGRLWIDRLRHTPLPQQQQQQGAVGGKRHPDGWGGGEAAEGPPSFAPYERAGGSSPSWVVPSDPGAETHWASADSSNNSSSSSCCWPERAERDFEPPFATAAGADDPANCGGFHLFSVHLYLQQQQQQQQQQQLSFEGRTASAAEWGGFSGEDWQQQEQQGSLEERQQQQQEIRAAVAAIRSKHTSAAPRPEEAAESSAAFKEWLQLVTFKDAEAPAQFAANESAAAAVAAAAVAADGASNSSDNSSSYQQAEEASARAASKPPTLQQQQQQQQAHLLPLLERSTAEVLPAPEGGWWRVAGIFIFLPEKDLLSALTPLPAEVNAAGRRRKGTELKSSVDVLRAGKEKRSSFRPTGRGVYSSGVFLKVFLTSCGKYPRLLPLEVTDLVVAIY
ncbi:hypothetical protein Efla_002970 [Eimeria flavescens]